MTEFYNSKPEPRKASNTAGAVAKHVALRSVAVKTNTATPPLFVSDQHDTCRCHRDRDRTVIVHTRAVLAFSFLCAASNKLIQLSPLMTIWFHMALLLPDV